MAQDTARRSRRSRRNPLTPDPQEGPRAKFRQLLPFLFEHNRVLIVVLVLSVLSAGATLVQPLLVGAVIGRVEANDPFGPLVWALIGFVILSSVITGYQHYLLQRTGTAVVYSSRRRLIARMLHLPISEFDARRTGDLVSRVGTDTTMLYAVLTQGLADTAGSALIFIGALIAMLVIDPLLLLTIVVVIGASVAGVGLLSGRIRRASADQQERVGELSSGIERAIGAIRTIRAAGATEREQRDVTAKADEAYAAGVRVAKASALVVPIAGVAVQISLLVVLGVGGLRVASGAIGIASLVTFVMFLFLLIMPLGNTFGAMTSVGQALGALGRIQEVLDLPAEDANDTAQSAPADGGRETTRTAPVETAATATEGTTREARESSNPVAPVAAGTTIGHGAEPSGAHAEPASHEADREADPDGMLATTGTATDRVQPVVNRDSATTDRDGAVVERHDTVGAKRGDEDNAAGGSAPTAGDTARARPEGAVQVADRPAADGAEPAIAFREVRFRYPRAAVAAREAAAREARKTLELAHLDNVDGAEGAATTGPAASSDDGQEVLRGVSFDVPRGSRVALVGPSGAGKSTILALIERFYDPTSGQILLDGRDIRSIPRPALRASFGYVEQDAPTLAGTIADNLRLATPDATDAECEEVLRSVNLGSVIERNPLGVDTPVGEDGVMLSGGERQRLAIARAILAAPPILLLDESTSSLDGANERRMREAIDAVSEGRTLIVIAHRLSTVIDSDKIVVLDRGEVAGAGTHAMLVESVPLYRDLARHQLLV